MLKSFNGFQARNVDLYAFKKNKGDNIHKKRSSETVRQTNINACRPFQDFQVKLLRFLTRIQLLQESSCKVFKSLGQNSNMPKLSKISICCVRTYGPTLIIEKASLLKMYIVITLSANEKFCDVSSFVWLLGPQKQQPLKVICV